MPDDLFGEVETPPVSAAWLRRLGNFPFWRGEASCATRWSRSTPKRRDAGWIRSWEERGGE